VPSAPVAAKAAVTRVGGHATSPTAKESGAAEGGATSTAAQEGGAQAAATAGAEGRAAAPAAKGGATSAVEEGGTQACRPQPRAPPHRPRRGCLHRLLELIPNPRSISSPTTAVVTCPHRRPPPRRSAATLDEVASSVGLRAAVRHRVMAVATAAATVAMGYPG
jgi:hypothetical protein